MGLVENREIEIDKETGEVTIDYTPSPIMKYFAYTHLPPKLQEISKPIADVAFILDQSLENGAEKSAGLRKLLEAKDCFVRAAI